MAPERVVEQSEYTCYLRSCASLHYCESVRGWAVAGARQTSVGPPAGSRRELVPEPDIRHPAG
jgi:hypothetical protein